MDVNVYRENQPANKRWAMKLVDGPKLVAVDEATGSIISGIVNFSTGKMVRIGNFRSLLTKSGYDDQGCMFNHHGEMRNMDDAER